MFFHSSLSAMYGNGTEKNEMTFAQTYMPVAEWCQENTLTETVDDSTRGAYRPYGPCGKQVQRDRPNEP
jgi:hypothetical protein